MTINDWPGRRRAQSLRHWSTLEAVAGRVAEVDAIDGLILLGSFASGDPDEVSDIDVLAVVAPGRFQEAWAERRRLAGDALVTWERRAFDGAIGWFTWLTRDIVKVECGIVDPASGARDLTDPVIVLIGDASLGDRFPRVSPAELAERRRRRLAEQQVPEREDDLTNGELIDWKLSELKQAVRRGLGGER